MAGVGQCANLKVKSVADVGQRASLKIRKCTNPCVGLHGVAKASGVRRCVQRGCGAVSARVWRVTRLILLLIFL